jgi:hypothetical protein
MGSIETNIDLEQELSVVSATGTLTAQEIREAIDAYYAGIWTRLIIWDFSSADLSRIKAEEVASLVQSTIRYTDRRNDGRTALLLPSDLAFGMGRMFEMLADLQGDTPTNVQYRSFRDCSEAFAWLQGSD